MKAARFNQFGGPEVIEIVDLPDPHPGPGQVRIAVRAAGVNPSDWKKRKGLMVDLRQCAISQMWPPGSRKLAVRIPHGRSIGPFRSSTPRRLSSSHITSTS
jgi:hypothetical protein